MDSTYEESSADTEVSWEELFDLQNQLQEDRVADQLTLFEGVDPFTDEMKKK